MGRGPGWPRGPAGRARLFHSLLFLKGNAGLGGLHPEGAPRADSAEGPPRAGLCGDLPERAGRAGCGRGGAGGRLEHLEHLEHLEAAAPPQRARSPVTCSATPGPGGGRGAAGEGETPQGAPGLLDGGAGAASRAWEPVGNAGVGARSCLYSRLLKGF